jgi:hypothetical protein
VEFSDPFKAISWDRMHSYAHGLGGKHIWPLIENYITGDGRGAIKQVDERYTFFCLSTFSTQLIVEMIQSSSYTPMERTISF